MYDEKLLQPYKDFWKKSNIFASSTQTIQLQQTGFNF